LAGSLPPRAHDYEKGLCFAIGQAGLDVIINNAVGRLGEPVAVLVDMNTRYLDIIRQLTISLR
jgi:hypothetical protein